jgi:uncharacterized protein
MSELRFEWDAKKNRDNRRCHKVSFEEAETTFADEHGLLMADPDHSEDEDRFILLGLSATYGCWSYATPIVRKMK